MYLGILECDRYRYMHIHIGNNNEKRVYGFQRAQEEVWGCMRGFGGGKWRGNDILKKEINFKKKVSVTKDIFLIIKLFACSI